MRNTKYKTEPPTLNVLHSTLRGLARGSRIGFGVNIENLIDRVNEVPEPKGVRDARRCIRTYIAIADALYDSGDKKRSAQFLIRAVATARQFELGALHVRSIRMLAATLYEMGAYDEANHYLEEGVASATEQSRKQCVRKFKYAKQKNEALIEHYKSVMAENLAASLSEDCSKPFKLE